MLRPRKCFHTLLEKQGKKTTTANPLSTAGKPLNVVHIHVLNLNKLIVARYLLRDAPRARITGSVISIMDCRVEVPTMKRMMLRRKVRCSASMSNSPVWRASSSRVTPSVTPLENMGVNRANHDGADFI